MSASLVTLRSKHRKQRCNLIEHADSLGDGNFEELLVDLVPMSREGFVCK